MNGSIAILNIFFEQLVCYTKIEHISNLIIAHLGILYVLRYPPFKTGEHFFHCNVIVWETAWISDLWIWGNSMICFPFRLLFNEIGGFFSLKWNILLPTDIYYIYSCRILDFTQHPYLQYYQNWTFLAWYTVAYWISMHVLSQRLGCDFTSFSFRFLKNVEQRSLWLLPHFLEVIIYILYNLDSYIW